MLDRIAMRRPDWEQAIRTVCLIAARHILVSTASLPIHRIGRAVKLDIGRTRSSAYRVCLIEHRERH